MDEHVDWGKDPASGGIGKDKKSGKWVFVIEIKKTGKGRIRNAGTGDIPMKPEFAYEFVKESCELIPVTADDVCLLFAGKDPELIDPYVSEKIKINATPSQIEKGLISTDANRGYKESIPSYLAKKIRSTNIIIIKIIVYNR